MYDELIKRLRNRRICIQQSGSLDDFPLLNEAADAIEELSKQHEAQRQNLIALMHDKPRWIPVTERLPEEVRKSYLCRTDSGYHCEVRWTDNVYGLWTGGGGKWGWSIFDIPQYEKVTHWMPLPEPPKGE